MATTAQLVAKAEAGYAAGHHDVASLVQYMAGDEDLSTRLYAGPIAYATILKHAKGAVDLTAPARGLAKDLGDQAITNAKQNTGIDSVQDAAAAIREVAELPTRILQWLTDPRTWARIGYLAIGSVLIVVGVAELAGARTAGVKTIKKFASSKEGQ